MCNILQLIHGQKVFSSINMLLGPIKPQQMGPQLDVILTPMQNLNHCAILMPFSTRTISPAFSRVPPACCNKHMQVQNFNFSGIKWITLPAEKKWPECLNVEPKKIVRTIL